MPRFLVTVSERHAVTYLVEGENADEIEEAYEWGEPVLPGWKPAVQVHDDIVGNDVVLTTEESEWSPLDIARVTWALRSKQPDD